MMHIKSVSIALLAGISLATGTFAPTFSPSAVPIPVPTSAPVTTVPTSAPVAAEATHNTDVASFVHTTTEFIRADFANEVNNVGVEQQLEIPDIEIPDISVPGVTVEEVGDDDSKAKHECIWFQDKCVTPTQVDMGKLGELGAHEMCAKAIEEVADDEAKSACLATEYTSILGETKSCFFAGWSGYPRGCIPAEVAILYATEEEYVDEATCDGFGYDDCTSNVLCHWQETEPEEDFENGLGSGSGSGSGSGLDSGSGSGSGSGTELVGFCWGKKLYDHQFFCNSIETQKICSNHAPVVETPAPKVTSKPKVKVTPAPKPTHAPKRLEEESAAPSVQASVVAAAVSLAALVAIM